CMQAVVPEYLMCLTFFVRTFLAGNSAACEVSVSTLGPPSADWDDIRNRLRIYDREKAGKKHDQETWSRRKFQITTRGAWRVAVRYALENRSSVFKSAGGMDDALHFKAFEEEGMRHEKEQADRIVESTEHWPGLYTQLPNWRELHSLTFTTDFFG